MKNHAKNIYAYLSPLILRQLSIGALVLWVPVLLFALLANEVTERKPLPFDIPILEFLHSLSSPGLDSTTAIFTDFGGLTAVSLATIVLAAACYRFISRRTAFFVVFAAGGAAAMNLVLKTIFQRARPDLWQAVVTEKSFSFPSGHAMASSALAFSLMVVFWDTRWRWPVVIGATIFFVLIGISRMYLGVHYPSDVLGGWCISLAWILVVQKIFGKQRAHRLEEPNPV